MDGFKRKLTQSLQYKLSAWLCVTIIAMAIVGGTFSFATAFEEANELQDDQLKQVAALIHGQVVPLVMQKTGKVAFANASVLDTDPEFRIVVQIIKPTGIEVLVANQRPLLLPVDVLDGIQTVTIRGEAWRIFVKTLNPQQRVAVAQLIQVRDEVAQESAMATIIPFMVLIPVLLILVSYLIREMFKPVATIAIDLDKRSEQDLHAIDETNLPSEVLPFVVAINRMLTRVGESVEQQRRFVADAAHEMRTPLTALSLQLERLEAVEMSEPAKQRLSALKNGLERTRLLLNQLLAFARAQQVNNEGKTEISLQHVIRRVLEDLMPLADAKHIDIGVVSEFDATVSVQEFDLAALIKNLVDNAIRYTPDGGKVDLLLARNLEKITLKIVDTGPGISEAERERVFDPFYRVLGSEQIGSGLGLSIVKTIATRIGVKIELSSVSENSGLCVSVIFHES